MDEANEFEYVGFWARVWASIIDTVLLCLLLWPVTNFIDPDGFSFSWDASGLSVHHTFGYYLVNYILPGAVIIAFWLTRQATPGKMAIGAKVVDARTGGKLTPGQSIGRYLGYFVSTIPFCLGLIWVGFDSRKQGWHDKLAGTVVVRSKLRGTEPVRFDGR